ncbi:MAG TPA: hypothetical protein VF331_07220 [Polyangiales bacterium]
MSSLVVIVRASRPVDDAIQIDRVGRVGVRCRHVPDPDIEVELAERSEHEADLSARLASLDLHEPLAAYADALRELRLIHAELDPTLANRQADVLRGSYAHPDLNSDVSPFDDKVPMSPFDDIRSTHGSRGQPNPNRQYYQ